MAQTDSFNPGQESAAVTASPNLQTVQARYDPNADVNSLLTAIGSESTQKALGNFKAEYEQRKLQEQAMKIDGYSQQFMQDHSGGAVSQAQVKERFPETVPVIAARIAESIGKKQGALDVAASIEEINNNDSLRLDTTARTAYIAKKRAELFGNIPAGNDFYAAGVAGAMDRSFQEQELKWQGQTATYHQEVQKNTLSGEVVTALSGADTTKALAAIFENYKMSSSINPLEFNKVAVDAAIKLASQSDDPSILAKLPQRYLNVDSKAAIFRADIAIGDQRMKNHERVRQLQQEQRDDEVRSNGLIVLKKLQNGEPIRPLDFKDPASVKNASELAGSKIYPDHESKAKAMAWESSLMSASFVGSIGTTAQLTQRVFELNGLNAAEKAALIEKIPKLLQGTVLMNGDDVSSAYKDNIGSSLAALSSSGNANLTKLMTGKNLVGTARSIYENSIKGQMNSYYSDPKQGNGEWAGAYERQGMISKAIAETRDYVERNTTIDSINSYQALMPAAPKGGTAAPSAQSKAPSASKAPPQMSLVDQEIARRMKK